MSQKDFCLSEGISLATLHRWLNSEEEVKFTKVNVEKEAIVLCAADITEKNRIY